MKAKTIFIIFFILSMSGCVTPLTIHDNGTIMMNGKELSIENKTLEGWDTEYSQVLYDNLSKEWFPMEFEIEPCGHLERELERHGQNNTYGNFALTVENEKIIKWEIVEGNWSKVCEVYYYK